jgi:hypothetical protein
MSFEEKDVLSFLRRFVLFVRSKKDRPIFSDRVRLEGLNVL